MSLTSCPCDFAPDDPRAFIAACADAAGIDRLGFAVAGEVDACCREEYERWIAEGCNAGMGYLERYPDVRNDPRKLLEGARSVISCAISYWHPERQAPGAPRIGLYAHGDDYHDVVRCALEEVAAAIRERYGAECRVCVDTAPIHERYWAAKSGVGFRGANGTLIVPGVGSYCFLGEIVTTLDLSATPPLENSVCEQCGLCVKACPGGALRGDGTIDCRRCLSYMTIEHRGDFPDGFTTGGRLAGCDTCQEVCPHNKTPRPGRHPGLGLRDSLKHLTAADIIALTPDTYAAIFKGSALKRLKLAGLRRNAGHL